MTDREALTGAANWLRWFAEKFEHDTRLTESDRRELATLNARLLMMSQTVEIEERALDVAMQLANSYGNEIPGVFGSPLWSLYGQAATIMRDLAAVDPDANLKDEVAP